MYSLLKYCFTWSSSTKGTSSLLQTFSVVTRAWESWRPVLSVQAEAKNNVSFFHVLCHQVPCPIQQRAHTFFNLPFVTCVLIEALHVTFNIPCQICLKSGFGLPNPKLRQYLCIPSRLTVPVSTFFMLPFCVCVLKELMALLPDFLLIEMDCSWWKCSFNINQLSWAPPPSRALSQGTLIKQIFEEAKGHSPEVQGCDFTFCPSPSFQDPKRHYCTVPTAKAASELHIPNKPFLLCEYKF